MKKIKLTKKQREQVNQTTTILIHNYPKAYILLLILREDIFPWTNDTIFHYDELAKEIHFDVPTTKKLLDILIKFKVISLEPDKPENNGWKIVNFLPGFSDKFLQNLKDSAIDYSIDKDIREDDMKRLEK